MSKKSKLVFYIFIGVLLCLLPKFLDTVLQLNLKMNNDTATKFSKKELLILVVFVAPILETLIFQTLPIYLSLRYVFFNKKEIIAVIISALLFSLIHTYSLIYFIITFYAGIIYGILYMKVLRLYPQKHLYATLVIIIIHSLYNLVIFLL